MFLQMSKLDPGRKHPAHMTPVERHNEPIIIFVTVCSKDRKRIFACADATARSAVGAIDISPGREPGEKGVSKPISPGRGDRIRRRASSLLPPLPGLGRMNRETPGLRPGLHSSVLTALAAATPFYLTALIFWDTQLRRHENYDDKWEYVLQNPVRAELVGTSDEWPFQGELNVLRW
jgi:putative transposase